MAPIRKASCVARGMFLRNVEQGRLKVSESKGVGKGGVGVNPPLSLIFTKTLLPAQRRLIVFAYFLLVNLST